MAEDAFEELLNSQAPALMMREDGRYRYVAAPALELRQFHGTPCEEVDITPAFSTIEEGKFVALRFGYGASATIHVVSEAMAECLTKQLARTLLNWREREPFVRQAKPKGRRK